MDLVDLVQRIEICERGMELIRRRAELEHVAQESDPPPLGDAADAVPHGRSRQG